MKGHFIQENATLTIFGVHDAIDDIPENKEPLMYHH